MDDTIIQEGLRKAGVPKAYRKTDCSLTTKGDRGRQILGWLGSEQSRNFSRAGAVIELLDTDSDSADLFYLMARALFLRSCPVQCIDLLALRPPFTDELWDAVRNRGVLFVDGLLTEGRNDTFTSSQADSVEWFLIRWMNDNKSLVMLNEVTAFSDNPANYLSRRFRNRLRNRLMTSF